MAAHITLIATAFALVVGPLLIFIGFLPALIAGFALFAGPALMVGIVLAVVAAAAFLLFTHWKDVVAIFNTSMPVIKGVWDSISKNINQFIKVDMPLFKVAWDGFTQAIQFGLQQTQAIWNTIWPALSQVLSGVWDIIKGVVQVAWGLIEGIITVGLAVLSGNWSAAWEGIKKAAADIAAGIEEIFKGLWEAVKGFFVAGINSVIGDVNGMINAVNKAAGHTVIGTLGTIKSFDQGGYVPSTGMAVLHQGEFVLSKDMLAGKQSVPSQVSNTTTHNQPVTIYATVANEIDLNLLGYRLAFALRNSR